MFRLAAFLGLLGLAAATAIIVWSGWGQVVQALAQTGPGIFLVALFHLVPLTVSSESWRILVPGKSRPSLLKFIYFMWIRAAVNNLMPVARIGGEIASIRVMINHGVSKNKAIASTVVELTLSVAAIFLFVTLGVIFFTLHINNKDVTRQLAWGLISSLPLLVALVVVQKIGFFGLVVRIFRFAFRSKLGGYGENAARIDRSITTIYKRRKRITAAAFLQFLNWSLGSVEIWLSLFYLGHPLSLGESAMIEALIQGVAMAAFVIPGALGVQEAGFIFFGGMLGLPHEIAAALALMRRCRDLLCYAPGLIAWQAHEGKRLLR